MSDTSPFIPTSCFLLRTKAETLGKAFIASCYESGQASDEDMEDRCVTLLNAALDAVIEAEIPIREGIKLAVVPAQPQQRSAARGKRGGR
ncbi:hypothetical protein OJ996_20470 [Luteolibacter sp. GHJ8]|uniref:Uncharacterized protein n=1 Tax=Luteolibacter rhizosphaerae TaxID=2989719 RepID=A0ABT3G925_9BACT|nr:hypothetical protein [Luteolibacter rhizosphaerae]MCW1915974.1 hypothetical protein [Luteolibacter rhizosphaerae]